MIRRPLPILLVGLVVALGGCGDDEAAPRTTSAPQTGAGTGRTVGEGAPRATAPARRGARPAPGTARGGPPEQRPGGAGDEEPALSPALFTGRRGRISPRIVRVPPFIAIRVELRSADGRRYGLRVGGRTLRAGGPLASVSTTLEGLRPEAAVVGRPLGDGEPVRIVASAEPGP